MKCLQKIPVAQLFELKELYKFDWPLHISTVSTIQLFIDRFGKYPEWAEKVTFLSFGEDWRTSGAFIMINGSRVFFNTLEAYPFVKLKNSLTRMSFESDIVTFVNIRDGLRVVLLDLIRVHHFEIISDIATKSYLMRKDGLVNIEIK